MSDPIKLVVMDVDGVLTDGSITYDGQGHEIKTFHVHDGFGIKQIRAMGIPAVIITGRSSDALAHRATELSIDHIYQGVKDKLPLLETICEDLGINLKNVLYIGDDIPDLACMQAVGMPIAVANAQAPVKACAKWVTKLPGGKGAVREACNWVSENQ